MVDGSSSPKLTAEQAARFKRLAMPCLEPLLRTAKYLTHQTQEAEDLVQETMIKAMRSIDSFQEGTDIRAWLMTILHRAHIDAVRAGKRRSQTVSIDQAEMDVPARPDSTQEELRAGNEAPEVLLDRFTNTEVIEALRSLPEDIRWTLLLVDVEQMDHAAAAAVLQIPLGTIKSRAHRGRAMLHDRLSGWASQRGWLTRKESDHV